MEHRCFLVVLYAVQFLKSFIKYYFIQQSRILKKVHKIHEKNMWNVIGPEKYLLLTISYGSYKVV